ncbi:hypothetical protein ACHWQZ_G015320 [Mnemiopsis leidyi]
MPRRRATHAGDWYSGSRNQLDGELTKWLSHAETPVTSARAIISPHAGLVYCGQTGAHGFKSINPATTRRIIVLGPSHKKYLSGCALSKCSKFETPLYDLVTDSETVAQLYKSELFTDFDVYDDENEHSLEMQYPYIAKVMQGYKDNFKIVSIIVGDVSLDHAKKYAKVLEPLLADPHTVFVVSSDFCHWGSRFSYCNVNGETNIPIWQAITNLDKLGMDTIESLNSVAFQSYLSKTSNTICGRRPILLLLATVEEHSARNPNSKSKFSFLHYSQSSKCMRPSDSSVSYASGVLTIS